MKQLELSVLGSAPFLPDLLDQFHSPCSVIEEPWVNAQDYLAQIALNRSGPDVSEIGTTWLDSLVNEDAVRPFSPQEVDALGKSLAFVPSLWQTTSPRATLNRRVWAIPWLADIRLIFYWRDMLDQAGIDEATAFQTPEQVEETMERLQASDVETPWGMWTDMSYISLHNASTWIWQAGGDFLSDDGKQILFDQPEALDGLLAYLRLHRYVPPDIKEISWDVHDGYNLFVNRRVAVSMGPCGWFEQIRELTRDTDLFTKLGVASPPGPSFVGGSNLIVWQHTRRVEEAVDLVTFLTSKQAQSYYGTKESKLPVRLEVLKEPPYTTEPHYQVMAEVLKTGHSYPTLYRWGAVEERLAHVLIWLWNTLLSNPGMDSEALVKPYIEATARRLAITLGIRK